MKKYTVEFTAEQLKLLRKAIIYAEDSKGYIFDEVYDKVEQAIQESIADNRRA